MSDIVERLRNLEQWIRNPEGKSFTLTSDIFDEAADEIERLRAEVEEQARLKGMGVEREIAAEAEIKRLRKALATYACRCGDCECYVDEFVPSCGRSAREALSLILNANSLPYAQEIASKALGED
jgi:hypothetical protein